MFLVFSNGVAAVDLKNVDKSQIAGGPIGRTISNAPSSTPDRLRHVPYKYKSQRRAPLKEMYKENLYIIQLDVTNWDKHEEVAAQVESIVGSENGLNLG